MNYWSQRLKNKITISALATIILPSWHLMGGWLINLDPTQLALSFAISYSFLTYVSFWPMNKIPKWLKKAMGEED